MGKLQKSQYRFYGIIRICCLGLLGFFFFADFLVMHFQITNDFRSSVIYKSIKILYCSYKQINPHNNIRMNICLIDRSQK